MFTAALRRHATRRMPVCPRFAAAPTAARSERRRPAVARRSPALVLALASAWPTLAAQSPSAEPAAASAPAAARAVPDTIAQRVQACTTCHGREGRATAYGYFPRIAGKPAGYLFNQLVNFRDGRRNYPLMTYLVDQLGDDYLAEMAHYFAELDLPYPPPQLSVAPPALLERGRALALEGDRSREIPACTGCHGRALTGTAPAIPGLLGLPRDYVNAQIGTWKNGQRKAQAPDCMAQIAARLTPEDVAAVSAWLSAQPVPADARPAAALPGPAPLACGGLAGIPSVGGTTGR